ncbi:MerR family transcriptional regulator [bacterium]|nr:MerR family transcriptional regulator [bacterium]
MVERGKKLYYSITEVSEITDLKAHILRYWESEFPILHPKKNRAGNRIYREKDIDAVLLIKSLLYDEKFTIDGARRKIKQAKQQNRPLSSLLKKGAVKEKSKEKEGDKEENYRRVLEEVRDGLKELLVIFEKK